MAAAKHACTALTGVASAACVPASRNPCVYGDRNSTCLERHGAPKSPRTRCAPAFHKTLAHLFPQSGSAVYFGAWLEGGGGSTFESCKFIENQAVRGGGPHACGELTPRCRLCCARSTPALGRPCAMAVRRSSRQATCVGPTRARCEATFTKRFHTTLAHTLQRTAVLSFSMAMPTLPSRVKFIGNRATIMGGAFNSSKSCRQLSRRAAIER